MAFNYIPIDPCQPLIAALRIAKQESIPRAFIDWSAAKHEPRHHIFPDAFALRHLNYEKFCVSLLASTPRPTEGSYHEKRSRWMAFQLHRLELDFSNIVFLCSFLDWPWIREAYEARLDYQPPEILEKSPSLFGLEQNTLFFALSELLYFLGV